MATLDGFQMNVEVTPPDVGIGIMFVGDKVSFQTLTHQSFEYFEPQPDLPGSPSWTEDMNPGCQPDGAFSAKKRRLFHRELIAWTKSVVAEMERKRLYIYK